MYPSNPDELKTSPPIIPSAQPVSYGYGQAQPPPATGIPSKSYADSTETVAAPPAQLQTTPPGNWSSGLCGCFSDFSNCCITCWCPCITFGQIAEIVDQGSISCPASAALYTLLGYFTCCAFVYSCAYRSRLRKQYMLPGSPGEDCVVHCCCECCALCQEYRELKHRGFDMSTGWRGNVERQNPGVETAPMPQQGMVR